jgi:hypothetical protein
MLVAVHRQVIGMFIKSLFARTTLQDIRLTCYQDTSEQNYTPP